MQDEGAHMIRINQIKIPITNDIQTLEKELLTKRITSILKLKDKNSFTYEIVKKSIDARKKPELYYVYSVDVEIKSRNGQIASKDEGKIVQRLNNNNIMLTTPVTFALPASSKPQKVIIIGLGPAGLFCALVLARLGYKPVIFERGSDVDKRTAMVKAFWEGGALDINTNVQFGEGGAGTFSDGKLNTGIHDKTGIIRYVLETFVKHGAKSDILYSAKPHIGTDVLSGIVKSIRNEIISLGGEVHFESAVTDVEIASGSVRSVTVNSKDIYECNSLVVATGHSARDTFKMLTDKGLAMEGKAFAVGMRIIHSQDFINTNAYGNSRIDHLPAADYKVTARSAGGRGVYSFCMCPGGYVVNASSEEGMLCVNGMSYSGRNGLNANSAIIVNVGPEDFGNDILDGMAFQRKLEKAAYSATPGRIPVQLNEDFKAGRMSSGFPGVLPMVKGGYAYGNLREILPEYVAESIIDGMKSFDKMIEGFDCADAVWAGVESRTSSPVRIIRGEDFMSINCRGLYPCGEGAGYAGGITSAAVDGVRTALRINTRD